uniref:NADH dehydrogenase subunit 6 n=1 Tax=Plectus sambesii TaxID=2011161 RepID=A0A914WYL7_9BILA
MPLRTSSIPVWLIKLITVIIVIVVLILVLLQKDSLGIKSHMSVLVTALTCGILLGWSIGSVLQQVLTIRNVEIIANTCMTVLSFASLVYAAYHLIKFDDHSRYDWYPKEIGVLICFIIQSIVCLLMLSWALYGNIIVVQTR